MANLFPHHFLRRIITFIAGLVTAMVTYYKMHTPGSSSTSPSASPSPSRMPEPQQTETQPESQPEQQQQQQQQQQLSKPAPKRKFHALSAPIALPRPIPNSYWATPLLLACEYPWAPAHAQNPKLDAILRAGVRTFVDLTERGELAPYAGVLPARCGLLGICPTDVEYHRAAIRDRGLPASLAEMYALMDILRSNAARGRITAVHCRGGIGRTGMVVGCWLVESGVARDGKEALEIIAREWRGVEKCGRYPHSPETGPQFEFVAAFRASPKLRPRVDVELEVA